MSYKPLNEAEEEIRVLRFEDEWSLNAQPERLRISMENVSLNSFNAEYSSFQKNHETQPQSIWNDHYTTHVEIRRASLDQNVTPPTTEEQQPGSISRFTWGDYETLSYSWSKEPPESLILLNGVEKKVTSDLEAALRMLHRLPETQYQMRYWIDALCINQDDLQERNHQVKRMKNIYQLARAVVAWLGEEFDGVDRVIRVMRTTRRDASQNDRLIPPADFTTEDWEALEKFIKRRYWRRLWIIQELAVNHNSTLFVCGSKEMTRKMVNWAADCCQKLITDCPPWTRFATPYHVPTCRRIYTLIHLRSDLPEQDMLPKALSLAREAIASKPKDKIYGILALLPQRISSRIVPDYSNQTSIADVHTDLIMAIIRVTYSLEQIIYKSGLVRGWPSWVPDLQRSFPRHHIYYSQRQASKDTRPKYRFLAATENLGARLRVRGIRVDFVDGIAASPSSTKPPRYPQNRPRLYKKGFAQILGQALVVNHPKQKYVTFMKIPWDVENADTKSMPPAFRSTLLNNVHFWNFEDFRKANQNFIINGQRLKNFFPDQMGNEEESQVLHQLRLGSLSLKGRKLISTNSGYIGLVPKDVKRGDVVAVLLGLNLPVLLRPCGETYRCLGECFMQGLIEGEVFQAQGGNGLPYQNFVLV